MKDVYFLIYNFYFYFLSIYFACIHESCKCLVPTEAEEGFESLATGVADDL